MTTPQSQLYRLADNIKSLTDLFEAEDDETTIFDDIKNMQLEINDILASQKRMENQMNLIIKLLNKVCLKKNQ